MMILRPWFLGGIVVRLRKKFNTIIWLYLFPADEKGRLPHQRCYHFTPPPFAADTALLPNEKGIDTLYILVKATFNIGEQWTLADEQRASISCNKTALKISDITINTTQ